MNDYGAQIAALTRQLDKIDMKIETLAKACKVSLDYQPHSYEVNQLPEEEDEEETA
jgi:hypothetical protein